MNMFLLSIFWTGLEKPVYLNNNKKLQNEKISRNCVNTLPNAKNGSVINKVST